MNENLDIDPIGYIVNVLIARKWIIIIGFLSVFCVTLIGIRMMPTVYESYAKVFVSPPSLPRQIEAPFIGELAGRTFIGNQKEIIRSRTVYERVVKKLKYNEYKVEDNILKKIKEYVKKKILKLDEKTIDQKEIAINELKKLSSVEFIRGTNVALIIAHSSNPEGSAKIANTIAETYIEYANRMLSNKATDAYSYIENRVNKTRVEMLEAENKLNEYKERHGMLMVDEEKEFIVESLTEREAVLQKTNLDLIEVERLIKNIKANKNKNQSKTKFQANNVSNEELEYAKSLNDQLINLESTLNNMLVTVTEDHPDVKLIRTKIMRVKEKIKQYENQNIKGDKLGMSVEAINREKLAKLQNTRQELINRKDYLNRQKEILLNKKKQLTEKLLGFEKLNKVYLELQNKLLLLNSKLENAKILQTGEMQFGTIKLIEPAHAPINPTSTNAKILLVLGIFAGIVFGLGIAFIVDYFDDSFKNMVDIENLVGVQALGAIPTISNREKRSIQKKKRAA